MDNKKVSNCPITGNISNAHSDDKYVLCLTVLLILCYTAHFWNMSLLNLPWMKGNRSRNVLPFNSVSLTYFVLRFDLFFFSDYVQGFLIIYIFIIWGRLKESCKYFLFAFAIFMLWLSFKLYSLFNVFVVLRSLCVVIKQ